VSGALQALMPSAVCNYCLKETRSDWSRHAGYPGRVGRSREEWRPRVPGDLLPAGLGPAASLWRAKGGPRCSPQSVEELVPGAQSGRAKLADGPGWTSSGCGHRLGPVEPQPGGARSVAGVFGLTARAGRLGPPDGGPITCTATGRNSAVARKISG